MVFVLVINIKDVLLFIVIIVTNIFIIVGKNMILFQDMKRKIQNLYYYIILKENYNYLVATVILILMFYGEEWRVSKERLNMRLIEKNN